VLEKLLKHFHPNTYPLILAHDPNGLLENEFVLAALVERGFELIYEADPIHLRHRIERLKPFTDEKPIIIRTDKPLNKMPFDLWQQGHHIQLSLHTFFPNLSYPVIQQLTPSQIWKLREIQKPQRRLGHDGTIRFILKEVFGIDVDQLHQVDYFLFWLSEYHYQTEPMADIFLEFLINHINAIPEYISWPIHEVITNKDKFQEVLQDLWGRYINKVTSKKIGEEKAPYHMNFEESDLLQTQLGKLVQAGHLQPVKIAEGEALPYWIKPGVIEEAENLDMRRFEQLNEAFGNTTSVNLDKYRWEEWQQLAHEWAEFTYLRYKTGLKLENEQKTFFKQKQDEINTAFLTWLKEKYSPLASRQLPIPHHLYHVPHYLAHERSKGTINQVVLLVMDGMALADWKVIHSVWRSRHKDWQFDEKLLLAQLPTITAISRQALISGLRPIEFDNSLKDNRQEPKLWSAFWRRNKIAESDIVYDRLSKANEQTFPTWVDKPRLKVVCMVQNDLDDIIHNAMHGSKGFFSDFNIWLDTDSRNLEKVLAALINQGFSIYVTSDHGHVEATGFGKITDEGLTVETRAKRARVYNNINFASQNKVKRAPSFLWHGDNLLPEDVWALMPEKNHAYINENEIVVAHGGATIEEVVVPFVKIEK
jgi:hypothetical protein